MIESTSHAASVNGSEEKSKEYEQEVAIRCCHDPKQISAESDVRERVAQYFRSIRQVIEENGWCKFFIDQEGLKLKCKLLVASLEPQALREEIESILAYQNRTARSDEKVLFKTILEKALEHGRDFQRLKCPVATHDEKADILRQQHERCNRVKADRKKIAHD
ncbi:hypothetical protein F442_04380 [Phytophthora nicotianae P10297]|uniref:Uncharacterized protein n=1 Tax=Phytophthora nicotianae P10297 TaxID=1317064 RepID=W2ZTX2_PHYNI|nr:hypothetical protein F442_04380 [Phytophthora nicotianae P10297]